MSKNIAITLGDTRGVGPEITLKALTQELAKNDGRGYTIYGRADILRQVNEQLKIGCPLDRVTISDTVEGDGTNPALNAVRWLKEAALACMKGEADGIVTAPVSKEEIIRAGHHHFIGQTEFLSELAGVPDTVMMLLGTNDDPGSSRNGQWLRIALATTHVRLSKVAESLDQIKVENAIRRAAEACALQKLPRACIGVSGLNPHSGEGGKMGDEEQRVITPAIRHCRLMGMDVTGPIPADAILRKAWMNEFDAVVSMYHDQALPALKMVAFDTGINWTLGLPFIRVSPDHGTAFDIAGKGIASPRSMLAAINLLKQL